MEAVTELGRLPSECLLQKTADFSSHVLTRLFRNKVSLLLLAPPPILSIIHYNNMICLGYKGASERRERQWYGGPYRCAHTYCSP